MLPIAAALSLAIEAAAVLPQPHPIAMAEGLDAFEQLCLDGFPDPARAEAARSNTALGLVRVPPPPGPNSGDRWVSERIEHSYINAAWLPRDLPSPQCSVDFNLSESRNHLALAQELATRLPTAKAKLGRDRPADQSRWDMEQTDGTTFRLFLKTTATAAGTRVSLHLLNLRD